MNFFVHSRITKASALLIAGVLIAPVVYGQSVVRTPSSVPSHGPATAALLAPKVASSAPVPVPQPLTPPSYLSALETTNQFDPQRKVWPDKVPPAPPPVPPPLVTDQDLQLYGVVIVGQTKRATIKVGTRFSKLDAGGRGFVSVSEGQALGEWVLSEIRPTHLLLTSPGGQQTVNFNKKTDRVASATVQQSQAVAANEVTTNAQATPTPQIYDASAARAVAPPVPAVASAGTPGSVTASAATPGPNSADNALKNAPPGSLAAAISAAQSAAMQNGLQPQANVTPPSIFNPFAQLLQKQQ